MDSSHKNTNMSNETRQAQLLLQIIQTAHKLYQNVKVNQKNQIDIGGTILPVPDQIFEQLHKLITEQLPELAATLPNPDETSILNNTPTLETLYNLATNPTTTQYTLNRLLGHPDSTLAAAAAKNPGLDPEKLCQLAQNLPATITKETLLYNKSLPAAALNSLADDHDDVHFLTDIMYHPNCTYELKVQIIEKLHLPERTKLDHPDCPTQLLQNWELDDHDDIQLIATNPNCPTQLLQKIIDNRENTLLTQTTAETIAFHKNINHEIAQQLLKDPYLNTDEIIRMLAKNKNCPTETLQQIIQTPDIDQDATLLALSNPNWNRTLDEKTLLQLLNSDHDWIKLEIIDRLQETPPNHPVPPNRAQTLQQAYYTLLKTSTTSQLNETFTAHALLISLRPGLQTIPTLIELIQTNKNLQLDENLQQLTTTLIQLHLTRAHAQNQLEEASSAQKLTIQKLAAEQNITLPEINTTQNPKNTPGRTTTLNNFNKTKKPNITITP